MDPTELPLNEPIGRRVGSLADERSLINTDRPLSDFLSLDGYAGRGGVERLLGDAVEGRLPIPDDRLLLSGDGNPESAFAQIASKYDPEDAEAWARRAVDASAGGPRALALTVGSSIGQSCVTGGSSPRAGRLE